MKITDVGKIYNEHDRVFRNVSAFIVMHKNDVVARVTLKWATSGTRTTAFVHWLRTPMVKGTANGGGYDEASASVSSAAKHMPLGLDGETDLRADPDFKYLDFRRAALLDNGRNWHDAVRDAGFTVHQAV